MVSWARSWPFLSSALLTSSGDSVLRVAGFREVISGSRVSSRRPLAAWARVAAVASSSLTVAAAASYRRSTTTTTSCSMVASSSGGSADTGGADGSPPPTTTTTTCGYLDAQSAYALDQELMTTPGFTLDQLMELAGLAVAQAVHEIILDCCSTSSSKSPRIILVCGPGNNGGDGLVAARHLRLFGHADCTVVYPKRSSREPHYANLVQQLEDFEIPIVTELPAGIVDDDENGDQIILVDAIFGFSFQGDVREPFATMLQDMIRLKQQSPSTVQIVSVDVPSGWDVNEGDVSGIGLVPDVLISLTAPKRSARKFAGRHFVGGRFLPPQLAEKYGIRMPDYPGTAQVMQVAAGKSKASSSSSSSSSSTWEQEYAEYLAAKDAAADEGADAAEQDTVEVEDWQRQYAEYLAEKEKEEQED